MGVAKAEPTFPTVRLAVVIGTNYKGTNLPIPTLRGGDRDAEWIAALLEDTGYDVTMLVGLAAKRQAIIEAVDQACAVAGPQGLLILYFSGHATMTPHDNDPQQTSAYLCPADINPAQIATTGIAVDDLIQHHLKDVGFALVLLDACHSSYAQPYNISAAGRGRMILAASDAEHTALELSFQGQIHGAFTYWLHEHWANNPGPVDANSLFINVAQALETMNLSAPVLSGVQTGRVILRPALSVPLDANQSLDTPSPALLSGTPATSTVSVSSPPTIVINESTLNANLDGKRTLIKELSPLFSTPAELEKLTVLYIGETLAHIPTAGNDIDSLIMGVVAYCLSRGGNLLGRFLAGVLTEYPARTDLRDLIESLAAGQ